MKKEMLTGKFLVAAGLILAAALTRLMPHYPNFTAVTAIALFGGTYLNDKKSAFIIPLLAMLITDAIIGFHATMWSVYLSIALIVMIGFFVKRRKELPTIAAATVLSSVLFFAVTNFAVWLSDPFYAKTISGLVHCYVMAIPFFSYSIAGDLFFAAVLFGTFELVSLKFPSLVKVKI